MAAKKALSAVAGARVGLAQLAENQFELLRNAIGDARVVLIGEETHGTHEFYALRAEITKALVEREHFSLVLCESDFPSFYKLHQFVGGGAQAATQTLTTSPSDVYSASSPPSSSSSSPSSPSSSLPQHAPTLETEPDKLKAKAADTQPPTTTEQVMDVLKARFPVWMWRNEVVRDFVTWLRDENLRREVATTTPFHSTLPVALFGLDIYSMFASTDQVVTYLDAVDPSMAARARERYAALQAFRPSEADYCRAVQYGVVTPQASKIRSMLSDLEGHASTYKRLFGDGDAFFSAHENARVVLAAEAYYRESYLGDGRSALSWNIRDHAMVDMILNALAFHDEKLAAMHADNVAKEQQPQSESDSPKRARAVVWAHNSHIGDAAATEQFERHGQVNVGHLVRQALGATDCFLVGLTTNTGTVRAAQRWNGRDDVMELNAAIDGSVGALLHDAAMAAPQQRDFGLFFRRNEKRESSSSNDDNTSSSSSGDHSRHADTASDDQHLSPSEVAARAELAKKRPERFIGVQYIKAHEREAHYALCSASRQFDMLVHLDETTALRPLPDDSNDSSSKSKSSA